MKENNSQAQPLQKKPTPKASVEKLERERMKLHEFRENLAAGETLDETSIRTSLLGRRD